MYRYYRTGQKRIDEFNAPDPEPINWLGYNKDGYLIKTEELINGQEIPRDEIRDWKLKDQFPN